MKRLLAGLCMGAMLGGAACRKQEYRRAWIDVPDLRGEECACRVENVVRRQPGIDPEGLDVDWEQRRVVVVYDSMVIALKNIEHALAQAGFMANDVPADAAAAAALPEACRPRLSGPDAEPAP